MNSIVKEITMNVLNPDELYGTLRDACRATVERALMEGLRAPYTGVGGLEGARLQAIHRNRAKGAIQAFCSMACAIIPAQFLMALVEDQVDLEETVRLVLG